MSDSAVESPRPDGAGSQGLGPRMPVWAWLVVWSLLWIVVPVATHRSLHGGINVWHVLLCVFLAVNVLICIWELSLWRRIGDIRRWYLDKRSADRPRGNLYVKPITLREFFSSWTWAGVWLGYTRYDDGYADPKSFGFAIDVGNGLSTLVPSLLFHVGMTAPLFSPIVLGIIGLLVFYQKFYGTCLYFFQYVHNRRWEGLPRNAVIATVGGSNGIWFVFPLVGMYVCLRLVLENDFGVLGR